jgi:hypothetical protein
MFISTSFLRREIIDSKCDIKNLAFNITKFDVMMCKGLFYLATQLCIHEKFWMGHASLL